VPTAIDPPRQDPSRQSLSPETQRQLRAAQDLFIRRWGEMGQTWGINRTMAEIHALLYVVGEPLCTDDVMERLNISRGNASMSLRSLCDWGIVRRLHKRGQRREYFESLSYRGRAQAARDGPRAGDHQAVPEHAG
jgi:DNA-binding MarR family transcriptional regulator